MSVPIVVVRVYVTESRARLKRLLWLLRKSGRLRGATVFRGIAGFGLTSPETADATAPEDPPVVIEFFDSPDAVGETIRFLQTMIAPHHIVTFQATSTK